MFGLVKRELLLDAEKRCVESRALCLRLEKTLNAIERDKEKLAGELELAQRMVAMLERERDLLLQTLAARQGNAAPAPAEKQAAEPEPEMRSIGGFEAVVRATKHRNEAAPAPALPRVTEIFARASRQRRAAEAQMNAAAKTGTGA